MLFISTVKNIDTNVTICYNIDILVCKGDAYAYGE